MTEHIRPYDVAADALFLDFDGTLVDLAPQPEEIVVPPELITLLQRIQQESDGALAIVSGRPLDQLDFFLAPLRLPAAGVHGAERRTADGRILQQPVPDVHHLRERLLPLVESHPGLQLELKRGALALHYRHAAHLEQRCVETMMDALRHEPGFTLLHGKMVVEAKPHINKGDAVAAFLHEAPFRGRRPVFIGDDVTDEAGFAIAQGEVFGGFGIKIGAGPSQALQRLADPAAVLDLLRQSVEVRSTPG
ncbi:trehalose-phosphatase [Herbaspirillum huttiense]|uniref:Trehalose 6-phosphate phosphatase n=1 Tax=Herbaspirillum huttiense subsp. lycopersici TaxID=3074428 RepID=A0ABU2EVA7_9BURK|nr:MULTISPECIES: trehalose-phosphatase [Herbaspirillum]MAF05961.1 trehalose-phosphatase [Herbaspirillum sp.]MBN9359397.1 trehalose-phosphatase [Herbaspirillum huttiense]MBO15135.1 trehalose-phosphatase [Herbaspirillum sp.]MBP1314562.1 trehalose 6-phosphate phosphatase [Herbaspirillum sp. 1130]MCO4858525.1 trehalose-phosphatase [Herbaspirillum sp. WGmk3]|tara:strand:+ start:2588 stop:3334 length:747 start_codon:yes stop_codon:yes gene_type:complete